MQNKCKYKDEVMSHKTEKTMFFNQLPACLLHSSQLSQAESCPSLATWNGCPEFAYVM